MGNAVIKKLNECSCKSECQIEKDMKEIKKYFKTLSLDDLIRIREFIHNENSLKTETMV
jgi:hypothetical protein